MKRLSLFLIGLTALVGVEPAVAADLALPSPEFHYSDIGLTTASADDPSCAVRIAYADHVERAAGRNRFGQIDLKLTDQMARQNPLISPTCPISAVTMEHG